MQMVLKFDNILDMINYDFNFVASNKNHKTVLTFQEMFVILKTKT